MYLNQIPIKKTLLKEVYVSNKVYNLFFKNETSKYRAKNNMYQPVGIFLIFISGSIKTS